MCTCISLNFNIADKRKTNNIQRNILNSFYSYLFSLIVINVN